jgi:hypothetical protein
MPTGSQSVRGVGPDEDANSYLATTGIDDGERLTTGTVQAKKRGNEAGTTVSCIKLC